MRHQYKKVKLGSDSDHRRSLLRTLAMQVIIYEKVKTTGTKAKAVQPLVEKLITIAKTKDKMNAIRQIEKLLQHKNCSRKIFEDLLIRYEGKTSGFTRVVSLGNRAGDNAPVVQISLVSAIQSEAPAINSKK